ncbi:glycosyltransferase [bacterium]|nr:MAG: glycosyltransferase [bacterium]
MRDDASKGIIVAVKPPSDGARRLMRLASGLSANSLRCREDVSRFAPEARAARLVRFGAPTARPALAPAGLPRRFALCASRRADHKGLDVMVFAWSLLASRGVRIPLVLAGHDHSRGALTRFARRLGVADLLTDLGRLPHRRLLSVMRAAEFLVLPSREEGFGLAACEAMALGTPVLASRVGGVPELVRHGRDGLLVAPKDPVSLARAAERLWEDGGLRRRLGAHARRRAGAFSWNSAADGYARAARLKPAGRVAVVVWQDPRDQTGRSILMNAAAALRSRGFKVLPAAWAGDGRSPLAALAARRPDAWLVFLLRYRTAGALADFCAARGLRPFVALC